MTPELSDDIDGILDRFEARLRRKWSFAEQRIQREHMKRLQAAMTLDEPSYRAGVVKPSLDYYDNIVPKGRKRASY